MEQIISLTQQVLALIGIDGAKIVLGNTLDAYAIALVMFIGATALFGLLQFFVLAWLQSLAARTKTDLDDTFVKIVHSFRPGLYIYFAFWLALQYLSISGIAEQVVNAVLVLWLVAQAIVVVGILVEDVVFRHLAKDRDPTTQSAIRLLTNLVRGVMWIIGLLLVLSNFGIDITSLIAGAGIAGLAIAFALQGVFADLFSAFSIYFDKPFRVGDFIIVGDTMGTVLHIGVKSTRIKSISGEEIVLSNQDLAKAEVRNFKKMEERRIVFSFGILYETAAEKVERIPGMVEKIIGGQELARFDRAHFKSFGDSSLDFEVVYYMKEPDYTKYMDAQQAINIALVKQFESEGIGFAYPTRTIYMAQQ